MATEDVEGPAVSRERSAPGVVRRARLPEVRLPPLEAYGGAALSRDGDYDGVRIEGADLAGQDGAGARFLDCALTACALDETVLRRARLLDSVLTEVRGVGTDLAEAVLRDVEWVDARLGGVALHGATLERVLVRGGKWDCANFRGARMRDVTFEGCVLVEPDFGGARLERVRFADCAVRGADLTAATCGDVDLRGARPLEIAHGFDRLAGTVISPAQMLDLAPALAARLGVRVLAEGATPEGGG
ncbi:MULTISPECIES: pentapeptide repeat-containing protein [unclassified Streptomyces]|uniref:pentapeptide repeat-containing protein n=1 Tax=unclassified Streptomyces TaxID=2593676 RepID=UPI001903D437|nr:pentapeptide repeat-containing protein [Streptomyces sp. HSG2]